MENLGQHETKMLKKMLFFCQQIFRSSSYVMLHIVKVFGSVVRIDSWHLILVPKVRVLSKK